jgi:hypothetical protein
METIERKQDFLSPRTNPPPEGRSGGSCAFYLPGYGAANAAGSLGRQSRSGKACRAAWHQAAARLVPVSIWASAPTIWHLAPS